MSKKLQPNPIENFLEPQKDEKRLRPKPLSLFEDNPIDLHVLRKLENQSIISSRQFNYKQVIEICKLAAVLENFQIAPYHVLDGKIAITAFFEASTRTRLSFESAVMRLDGKIISIPLGDVTGTRKGETLEDIGEMFNAYGDVVVMRHGDTNSIDRIQKNLRIPLVNAGNGSGEHPTQALADWYALLKWRPDLADSTAKGKPIRLGILGTPGSMRAVKSFLLLSLLFSKKIDTITVISEMSDPFGIELVQDIKNVGIKLYVTNDLQKVLPSLDVIYMNSIAFLGDSYRKLGSRYKLSSKSNLKKNAVILHPLARQDELNSDLDKTPHNLYFSQAHGSVFVRQALLMTIFERLDRLPTSIPTIL